MYGKWPYQQNVDLIRSAEVKVNEEPDGTNKRRGCARTALIWHIRHPLVSILACKHTHTHTSTNTHTQAFRPDSLLGQMASWWGATRSFTRALGWFVTHNLHTSLLLTPSSTHTAEGWTVKKNCIILHYPYSYMIIDCEIMWNYCIN